MKIVVNGEEQTYNVPQTVTTLLQRLNLRPEHVAVEINLTILDRSNFPTWNLKEGDKIEILSFIGGGSLQTQHSRDRKRYES
jgi:thiamine biosynthesis protein ThiS